MANPSRIIDAHLAEARELAKFLRDPATQKWISEFGKGRFDDRPLFFPVLSVAAPTTKPTSKPITNSLVVAGEIKNPLDLSLDALSKLPQRELHVKDRDGKEQTYSGVLVRDVLKLAGAPLENHQMPGSNLALYVVAEAADGYKAVFALAEFDDDFRDRAILLATTKDGEPLDAIEGPIRLIVPDETRPARWGREIVALRVERAQ